MKRLVAMGDLHCGSWCGLSPIPWQYHAGIGPEYMQLRGALQRETWGWYERQMAALQPIDVLVVNGDMIDGKGGRSGGTELITADLRAQAEMAAACIRVAKAKKIICTFGTSYHVSADGEDIEAQVADMVGASIGGHEWVDVNGCVFDIKHKVGSSQVPHGRYTSIAKENLWNVFWREYEGQPRANVFLRSHVHAFNYCGNGTFLGITLPALQGFGSKFGERQCSGVIDYGFAHFDIDDNGNYSWKSHLLKIRSVSPQAVKV